MSRCTQPVGRRRSDPLRHREQPHAMNNYLIEQAPYGLSLIARGCSIYILRFVRVLVVGCASSTPMLQEPSALFKVYPSLPQHSFSALSFIIQNADSVLLFLFLQQVCAFLPRFTAQIQITNYSSYQLFTQNTQAGLVIMKRDEDSRVDNGVVWGGTGFMFLVIGVPIISVLLFA